MSGQSVLPFPTKRLRNVVLLRRSRADGGGDNSPYIGLENIESWTGKLLHNSVAADDNPSALVEGRSLSNTFEPGDVLLGKLRPYLAKAWVAEFPGRSTTEFLVMQPVEVESRFLRYVCLWRDFVDAVDASTFGSKMPRADWGFIGNISIPVPERRGQCAIADYLDRETARLDALVAAKERVLGLLAEKRRALIARAVTQGVVSPEQPVPPARSTSFTQESQSGFDASGGEDRASAAGGDGVRSMTPIERAPWQPCLAQDWRLQQIKRAFSITLGKMLQNNPASAEDEEVPYLKAQHVQWDGVRISNLPRMWASPNDIEALAVRASDLLVCEGGKVGRAAIVTDPPPAQTIIQNALHLVRCRTAGVPRFLAYVLRQAANQDWFEVLCNRSTISHFTAQNFAEMWAWLPDEPKQSTIADYLDRETAKLDALVAAIKSTIVLLKERRSALIAAAVTGQIDIRAAS